MNRALHRWLDERPVARLFIALGLCGLANLVQFVGPIGLAPLALVTAFALSRVAYLNAA